jgi:hypothetical protein
LARKWKLGERIVLSDETTRVWQVYVQPHEGWYLLNVGEYSLGPDGGGSEGWFGQPLRRESDAWKLVSKLVREQEQRGLRRVEATISSLYCAESRVASRQTSRSQSAKAPRGSHGQRAGPKRRARTPLQKALARLLERLAVIQRSNPEIADTAVREELSDAVFHGFVSPRKGYRIPADLGLDGARANQRLRKAVETYVTQATKIAAKQELSREERRAAFEDPTVLNSETEDYEDFFGIRLERTRRSISKKKSGAKKRPRSRA